MVLYLLNLHCHFYCCQKKRMMLSHRLRGHNLIEEEDLYTLITKFKSNVKTPFMNDLIAELNNALKINDPVLLAFDVFNVSVNFPEEERKHHTEVLLTFYGTVQSSTFQSNNSVAPAVPNSIADDETIRSFFEDFKSSVAREEKKRNNEIKMLVQLGKLKAAHVFFFCFFFYLGFLSRTFTIHRTAGEGGGYLFNSSLPLPPASQTLRH